MVQTVQKISRTAMDAFPENTDSYNKAIIYSGKVWVRSHYFQIFSFRSQESS